MGRRQLRGLMYTSSAERGRVGGFSVVIFCLQAPKFPATSRRPASRMTKKEYHLFLQQLGTRTYNQLHFLFSDDDDDD